jgi:hypothetical protein
MDFFLPALDLHNFNLFAKDFIKNLIIGFDYFFVSKLLIFISLLPPFFKIHFFIIQKAARLILLKLTLYKYCLYNNLTPFLATLFKKTRFQKTYFLILAHNLALPNLTYFLENLLFILS